MTTDTHTLAGRLASTGAARVGVVIPAPCTGSTIPAATYAPATMHPASGSHLSSTWTKGAFATTTTFMVLNGKNRPTRPLSELSP